MTKINLDIEYYVRKSNYICSKKINNDYCDTSFKSRQNLIIHYIKNHYDESDY